MRRARVFFVISEFIVIFLMSFAATYGFQCFESAIQSEISGFRSVIYLMINILSFSSLYRRNKRVALLFSSSLSILLLLLITYRVTLQSPLIIFSSALMIGIMSVIAIPEARGKEFAIFLIILVLPVLLTDSMLLSSILTQEIQMPFHYCYILSLTIIGGYLYVDYATWIRLVEKELLLKGGEQSELTIISRQNSMFALIIIACAMGINIVLAEFVIFMDNTFSFLFDRSFIFLLFFVGMVALVILTAVCSLAERT